MYWKKKRCVVFLNNWVNELDSGWYIYFWDFILKILKNLIFMNFYELVLSGCDIKDIFL